MPNINPEKFYTPNEIAEMGIMTARSLDTRKQMLLRYIRQKQIEAVNVGTEQRPRYVVQGKHLITYRKAQMQRGQYVTK